MWYMFCMVSTRLHLRDTEEIKDTGGTPKTAGGTRPTIGEITVKQTQHCLSYEALMWCDVEDQEKGIHRADMGREGLWK